MLYLAFLFYYFFVLGFPYPVMHFRLDMSVFQCIAASILYVYYVISVQCYLYRDDKIVGMLYINL